MASFVFPDLLAGTFDLSVSLQGFKPYEQKGIVLASTERIALRAISLDVGGLSETIYGAVRGCQRADDQRGPHRLDYARHD